MITKQGTYCTVLTPPGAGAIAMVRVCGPEAHTIVSKSWRSRRGRSLLLDSRDRLRLGRFMDGEEVVDDVIVVYSDINGNRTVDICAHGGTRIVERILRTLHDSGAPLHENAPRDVRVWPSDNMIETELVQLMSRCKTLRALRFLSRQRRELVSRLQRAAGTVDAEPAACKAGLDEMIAGYQSAKILIEGATVALIGPPNSGKSTLFNRLIGRSAAIASPEAGTTRDWVAREIEIRGIAVTLVDTAGRPDSGKGAPRKLGSTERQAIEAGLGVAEKADLCVLLLDASANIPTADLENWRESVSRTPVIVVANKNDCRASSFPESVGLGAGKDNEPVISVSARTGAGLEEFVEMIVAQLVPSEKLDEMPCFCTRRQVDEAVRIKAACDERPEVARRMIVQQLIAG